MSEVKIQVLTRLRRLTDFDDDDDCIVAVNFSNSCLEHPSQEDPVHNSNFIINLHMDATNMQKENAVNCEISHKEEEDDEEDEAIMEGEELDTFVGFDFSPVSLSSPSASSSKTDSPNNATSSPINIPENTGCVGQRMRCVSSGTPTFGNSYLNRMFVGQHSNSGSPLSSGYGSAPRNFQTASTQTITPMLRETRITLRMPSVSNYSIEERQLLAVRRQLQDRRSRVYSENNGDDLREEVARAFPENPEAPTAMPLPDVVTFRDRSNSAPSNLMRPEIRVGRQLRRISDEFQLTYHDQQRLRAQHQQSILQRMFNIWRGNCRRTEGSSV